MDDQQLWHSGMARLGELLAALPQETQRMVSLLLDEYGQLKEAIARITSEVDAAALCRQCAGQCCMNGKYRFNVLDACSCVAAGISVAASFAQKPLCPYGADTGCLLEARYRPLDCILFVCDDIDQALTSHARQHLDVEEQRLRSCLAELAQLLGEPLATPLLLWEQAKRTNFT